MNIELQHSNQRTDNYQGITDRVGDPRYVTADIVIPVYNEQEELESAVTHVMYYLTTQHDSNQSFSWQIVIADNASTDNTWSIARSLAYRYPDAVRAVHINRKGRGFALKAAWGESQAHVCAYMDVDLSTDLRHIHTLINSIVRDGNDVAFGCRLADQSDVTRSVKREFISRTYNLMLRTLLGAHFKDAQCGFKAVSQSFVHDIVPEIVDNEWFFDTELLLLGQALQYRMVEIPVHWIEDAGSTVHISDTVRKDLQGMVRMFGTIARIRAWQDSQAQQHAAEHHLVTAHAQHTQQYSLSQVAI